MHLSLPPTTIPTKAPIMQCVVDKGKPIPLPIIIELAVAHYAQNPL